MFQNYFAQAFFLHQLQHQPTSKLKTNSRSQKFRNELNDLPEVIRFISNPIVIQKAQHGSEPPHDSPLFQTPCLPCLDIVNIEEG